MGLNVEESVSGPRVPLGQGGVRQGDALALALGSRLPAMASPDSRNTPAPTTPRLVRALLPSLH